ncbi:DUF4369 domain-containing protein [Mucilaginibacter endophyticus]|uniref:DUF4369 domain-containing protein n=1 Tax=Mucilaginibacter endophyticus TaxID=2675003 RepID=UPI001379B097|nr:DUF4369 domain-containing protein [Mucilaginibacter endophyticus]
MKRALYFVAMVSFKILPAFAQDLKKDKLPGPQKPNFTMNGKIGHLNKPAKVYLEYNSDEKSVTDSCDLVDGVFQFSGYLSDITYARMALSREGQRVANRSTNSNLSPSNLLLRR